MGNGGWVGGRTLVAPCFSAALYKVGGGLVVLSVIVLRLQLILAAPPPSPVGPLPKLHAPPSTQQIATTIRNKQTITTTNAINAPCPSHRPSASRAARSIS